MKHSEIKSQFDAYLLTERRVSSNTFGAYSSDIDQFLAFCEQHQYHISTLNLEKLKLFLSHLREQPVGPRSLARKISALKVFFSFVAVRYALKNIAQDLLFPKLEKTLPHYLTEQEIERLFAYCNTATGEHALRNKAIIFLLYVSGIRVSELTQLKVSDIYFDTGFIQIRGKGGKERMVPLPLPMLEILRTYLETVHTPLLHQQNNTSFAYLFHVVYGKKLRPITRQALWALVKDICKKCGISRAVSPHKLRHSLATHLLKRGADLRSLQLLLGHENISTVQVYTHVETSHLRTVYDKIHPRS